MIYKDHLGRAEIWVTRKKRIPFPLVRLKTYNSLLGMCEDYSDRYYQQAAYNGQWMAKNQRLEREIESLKKKLGENK